MKADSEFENPQISDTHATHPSLRVELIFQQEGNTQ